MSELLRDPDWLRHQYVGAGHTTRQIAALLGVSAHSVGRALHRAGIPLRRRGVRAGSRIQRGRVKPPVARPRPVPPRPAQTARVNACQCRVYEPDGDGICMLCGRFPASVPDRPR